MKEVIIFTDGSGDIGTGRGGWSFAALYKSHKGCVMLQKSGFQKETTAQRMELTAAAMGLLALRQASRVIIYSDSQYLVNSYQDWLKNWLSQPNPKCKNVDLWNMILDAAQGHEVEMRWIKAHRNTPEWDAALNRMVDKIAGEASRLGAGIEESMIYQPAYPEGLYQNYTPRRYHQKRLRETRNKPEDFYHTRRKASPFRERV